MILPINYDDIPLILFRNRQRLRSNRQILNLPCHFQV